jgi:transposase
VLLAAYAVAKDALSDYAHRFSPKKFTQPQLLACLILKEFFKTDYRGIEAILADSPQLLDAIELKAVPHFTTLQKAAVRLTRKAPADRLLDATIRLAIRTKTMKRRVALAAMDGTGLESRHISRYFIKRCKRGGNPLYQTTTYRRYPKLGSVCDCDSHIILSVVTSRGPSPDCLHYQEALVDALGRIRINVLLADAGYDSEQAHVFARKEHGVRTIIPCKKGRPTHKLPSGHYRRLMSQRFDKELYGQRWQVETVFSMMKRNLGSALRARRYWSQRRESMLRAIAHNVAILCILIRGFLQSRLIPFFVPRKSARR